MAIKLWGTVKEQKENIVCLVFFWNKGCENISPTGSEKISFAFSFLKVLSLESNNNFCNHFQFWIFPIGIKYNSKYIKVYNDRTLVCAISKQILTNRF